MEEYIHIKEGGSSHALAKPPPRQAVGGSTASANGCRKKFLIHFLWVSHVMLTHFTSAWMCSHACACACLGITCLPKSCLIIQQNLSVRPHSVSHLCLYYAILYNTILLEVLLSFMHSQRLFSRHLGK